LKYTAITSSSFQNLTDILKLTPFSTPQPIILIACTSGVKPVIYLYSQDVITKIFIGCE
jgi:hypothetical protein